jgi:hypothetical protein
MHKALVALGVGSLAFFAGAWFAGFGGNWLALLWGPAAFVTGYLVSKWY